MLLPKDLLLAEKVFRYNILSHISYRHVVPEHLGNMVHVFLFLRFEYCDF